MPHTVITETDRAALIDAIAIEGWPVELAGAVVDDTGWENVVLDTADGWIVRFPRSADTPFEREMALLALLAERLPVPIPKIIRIGSHVRVAAYRKIAGTAFDPVAYQTATPSERNRLAVSLAAFLAAMHGALSAHEIAEAQVPGVDHSAVHQPIMAGLARLPAAQRAMVQCLVDEFADTWVAGTVPGPRVPLHNDFHVNNMVFSATVGELAGIWDFSCVQVDVPSFDLRYFDRGPRDLLHRLADAYTARTGRPIDVPAAILARRIEDVHDILSMDRMELFDAAVQSWARADADR